MDPRPDPPPRRHAYYHRQILTLVRVLIPDDVSLLEVGCGAGDLLAGLPARERLGIDIDPVAVDSARRRHGQSNGLTFEIGDAEQALPRGFQYVLLSELIGSVGDVGAVLGRARAALEPDGRLVIITHNFLWQPLLSMLESLGLKHRPPVQNWLSPGDLDNFLYLADLEVVRTGRRVLAPAWVPLLSAFCNRVLVRLPGVSRLGLIHYVVARPRASARTERSVSVVVPARNERGNIRDLVARVPAFPRGTELIVVEGHSTDGTWEEIERVAGEYRGPMRLVTARQTGLGKGDAVRAGFARATGEVLMILDADMTVAPEDLGRFYDAYVEGRGDFINGSRLVYPVERGAMRFLNTLGNKFFALAFSWLLAQRIKDTLCGTKVIGRADYERLARARAYFGDFDPFGDFDLLFGAARLNLKIVELPIRYHPRTYGTTNIQRFRHGWLLLRMCIFAARRLKFNQ
jgi:SAM-dependent methyltransferase